MLNYTLTFTIRTNSISDENFKEDLCITACKQYCLAAGATQGNIAYTQTVSVHCKKTTPQSTETSGKLRQSRFGYPFAKLKELQCHLTN